ncbi:MAG: M28 family peptidase [Phycisphaera sp.]|nr:MAG: M28 family peptidase [Phycisphaera sp.]
MDQTSLRRPAVLLALAAAFATAGTASAQSDSSVQSVEGSPIADALAQMPDDVRTFDIHISTLASPYMQGRVPGSEGAERAKDYIEHYFRDAGLTPAFTDEDGNEFSSFRQPFPLSGTWTVEREAMSASSGGKRIEFEAEEDFMLTGMGQNGTTSGEAVFVGYGIENGPDGYNNFDGVESLEGKIAVIFRFEPMTEQGESQWNDGRRGWSGRAGFANKVGAVAKRDPAGIVIINPPGSSDPRAGRLNRFQGMAQSSVPVMMLSSDAGDRLLEAMGSDTTMLALRRHADEDASPMELGFEMELDGMAERKSLMAENVGGVIKGVGDLADEWIVVGAHLDHLGMGYFGSRSGPGELHPGADDNASGTAGLLLLAERLGARLADDGTARRSILIMGFDAEESGLNGSAYYTRNPIAPIEDHTLMCNWDMIGRVANERLLLAGGFTGEGMADFIEPYFAKSGLEIVVPETMSGASDHTPFYRAGVPVLFSIIADFHADYHTPDDQVWKINRVGAVKTVHLYESIVADASVRPERFAYVSPEESRRQQAAAAEAARPQVSVRVGVVVDSDSEGDGVVLAEITEDSPAAKAGLRLGDRLVRWDGQKLTDADGWRQLLARHTAGDAVNVGVKRGDEEVTLTLTLEGR